MLEGARHYNTNGHFTQPDPVAGGIGDPSTMTAYNYAGGDPINRSDPSGYCSQLVGSPRGNRTEAPGSGAAGTINSPCDRRPRIFGSTPA